MVFGDDLNKRISQISNTNSALAKPASIRPNQNGRYNKNQVSYNTTSNNHQQSKNGYSQLAPPPPIPTEERGYREKRRQAEQKNGLKIRFKERTGITSAHKIQHSEQEIKK